MKDGGRHVIAAGHDNFLYKVVEKYNVLEDNWTFANDMPIELSSSDSVPYEETFVVVGGQIGDGSPDHRVYSDAILLYKPMDDSWDVVEGALGTPKMLPTVISVKKSIFPNCQDI